MIDVLIDLDRLVYWIITFGRGLDDETLSGAAYRVEKEGRLLGRFFRPIIDLLFRYWMTEHCRKAFEVEDARRKAVSKEASAL